MDSGAEPKYSPDKNSLQRSVLQTYSVHVSGGCIGMYNGGDCNADYYEESIVEEMVADFTVSRTNRNYRQGVEGD